MSQPRFQLGRVVVTRGVVELLDTLPDVDATRLVHGLIGRHVAGDCGDMCADDKLANEQAIAHGDRIMSVYDNAVDGKTIWIITEWDRSVTTLLLPEEY